MAKALENTNRHTLTQGAAALHRFNSERGAATEQPNPYLSGPNQPMDKEVTLQQPTVRGTIPPQLQGCYARIGPNPVVKVNPAKHHWFAGDGMLHGVRLQDGQALWYRNRWIRSIVAPSITRAAAFASGTPVALATNGTVRDARGLASST